MGKLQLKCCKYGNLMETLPGGSQDIIIDEETGDMLYWCGKKCGYKLADSLVCEKCREKSY